MTLSKTRADKHMARMRRPEHRRPPTISAYNESARMQSSEDGTARKVFYSYRANKESAMEGFSEGGTTCLRTARSVRGSPRGDGWSKDGRRRVVT